KSYGANERWGPTLPSSGRHKGRRSCQTLGSLSRGSAVSQGRKILYFLGAGASRAAGAYVPAQGGGRIPIPTQGEFWNVFLRLCQSATARAEIESFLFRYFLGYRRVPTRISAGDR